MRQFEQFTKQAHYVTSAAVDLTQHIELHRDIENEMQRQVGDGEEEEDVSIQGRAHEIPMKFLQNGRLVVGIKFTF